MNKLRYDIIIVFLVSVFIFNFITFNIPTDIIGHTSIVVDVNTGMSQYPPNFLYYFVLNIFGLFTNELLKTLYPTIILLSTSIVAKYIITTIILQDYINNKEKLVSNKLIRLISFGLLFIFAIPDYYNIYFLNQWYLGRFPANVWHNSTVIFLMPFAILLFWFQLRVINDQYKRAVLIEMALLLLVGMNAFIKPSFLFVYAPIMAVYFILKDRKLLLYSKLRQFIPIIGSVVATLLLYRLIFISKSIGQIDSNHGVVFGAPFEVISSFIPKWYILISVVLSYLGVLIFLLFNIDVLKNKYFILPLGMVLLGLTIAFLIYEEGPRKYHFNFSWQNIVSTYLLFMCTIMIFVKRAATKRKLEVKDYIVGIVLSLHVISGIAYVVKLMITNSYV